MSPRESAAPNASGTVPDLGLYDRRGSDRADAFDAVTVSLEPGIALVQASAGTGKTFSITLAVLRLLLDRDAGGAYRVGDVGRILVVTFTNAATDELVTRVRAALRDAVDVFAGVVTQPSARNEALFALLDRYGAGELPRLRAALASLDRLAIFTIHRFCKRVLEESALESGTPYDVAFMEDEAELVERASQDWWRRAVYEDDHLAALAVRMGWTPAIFVADWKRWRQHPGTRLEPDEALDAMRAELAAASADFAAAWDDARSADYLATLAWRAGAPLGDPATRRQVVDAATAFANGTTSWAPVVAEHLTAEAIRHEKTGIKLSPKDRWAQVPDEPFVRAAARVREALGRELQALRVSCIAAIEAAFEAEKRQRHLLGFDDLLLRLARALEREGDDGPLARAIRARYDAALIDEFQDTDAHQFPIFRKAFAGRPLWLIGDPKQAIYGFRGADVFAYIDAARAAERRYTLARNWRSTAAMIEAVNRLFGRRPRPFVHDEIDFVRAVPAHAAHAADDALAADPAGAARGALHWWFVPPGETKKGMTCVAKREGERRILGALAGEVVRLVRAKASGGCGLRPGQLAVLVRTGSEGLAAQRALRAANVPAIVAGMGDILASPEMSELECVMRAVLAPTYAPGVRAALATAMWGMDALAIHRLARPEHEAEWERVAEQLDAARERWARHGFMRMAQEWIASQGALERLLAYDDGDRRVTNLRHAVELLHEVSVEERLSPEGLLLWIGRARASGSEDRARTEYRLESDADAVQIVTIHRSKGLEYDVVFVPSLWSARRVEEGDAVLVHEDDGHVFDHGSPRLAERARAADGETLAEDLRLAYVALTRARLRCYVGWGAVANVRTGVGGPESALGYLLRPEHVDGTPADVAARTAARLGASLGEWRGWLDALVAESGGTMSVEVLAEEPAESPRWEGDAAVAAEPRCRELVAAPGQLDTWRVASFTSLTTHGVEHRAVASIGADGADGGDARDRSDAPLGPAADWSADAPPARDDFTSFPAGRAPGIALHELLEQADFAAGDDALHALAAAVLVRHRLAAGAHDPRVAAAARMARTVLGADLPGAGFALGTVPRGRTLREWQFHLPLGAVGRFTLADAFARHGGDVARRYASALRALAPRQTWGYLTGVIDLAFEREGRWYVVDWKSNHLGRDRERYARAALEPEMFGSHYVLQYHLYLTALHRFLRARVPGYDYDTHVGGAWYAFLRGIDGTERGWYHDRPPRALVEALDRLMDEGARALGGVA